MEASGYWLEARSLDGLFGLDEWVRERAPAPFLIRDPESGVVAFCTGSAD